MAAPDTAKPAIAGTMNRPRNSDRLAKPINSEHNAAQDEGQADLPLVDRFGKRHGEQVLTAWSAGAIAAMQLRRLDGRPL